MSSESKTVGIEVVLSLELPFKNSNENVNHPTPTLPHSSLSLSKLTLTLVLLVAGSLHVIERGHHVDCLRPPGQPHSVVTSLVTPGIEDTEVSVSLGEVKQAAMQLGGAPSLASKCGEAQLTASAQDDQ